MNSQYILFIIIVVIICIIACIIYFKFRRHKKNCIQLFGGANGTGKSYNMTEEARKGLRIARSHWKRINKPFFSWIYLWIPYFNKKRKNNESYGLIKPELYSSYPIIINKKEISKSLTNKIMFLEESIPLNSQVVVDEFSGWISQFEYNEKYSKTLNDHLQKFRHYHGNLSHFYCADQCSNNIPIQVRYRCNNAIIYQYTRHYFKFIHISAYKYIDLTDDIKNVEILDKDNSDSDDKVCLTIRFGFKRHYDDRAYSNRYYFVDKNKKNCKYINSKLKVELGLLKPDKKKDYIDLDNIIDKELNS